MRISDWSSDVCSSDLVKQDGFTIQGLAGKTPDEGTFDKLRTDIDERINGLIETFLKPGGQNFGLLMGAENAISALIDSMLDTLLPEPQPGEEVDPDQQSRSEEHTSELQPLMRISYAVFCLKKKKIRHSKIPEQ